MALDCSRSRQCWCSTRLRSAVDGSYLHLPVPLRSARLMDFSRAVGYWAWPSPSGLCLRCGAGGSLKKHFEASPSFVKDLGGISVGDKEMGFRFARLQRSASAMGLVGSRLHLIDHEGGHSVEECPQYLLGLDGQRGFR